VITEETNLLELAGLVSRTLNEAGITAVLSGGGAVSAYTNNEYQSADLDFVCSEQMSRLEEALQPLGFVRGSKGRARYFDHPRSRWFVEFPPGPVSFGSASPAASEFSTLATPVGPLSIITPTQSVMDRLAAFFHWQDLQSFDQAVMVARHQRIDFEQIRQWARAEAIPQAEIERFLNRIPGT
jgi:hypothetical protein